jgi:hypothetical protein
MNYDDRMDLEEKVRKKLAKRFGKPSKRSIVPQIEHDFDFVSADDSVVGEVKTSEPNSQNPNGNLRTATLGDISKDCLFLLTAKRARKILVLTNKTVCQKFKASKYGKAAQMLGVEIENVNV